MLVATYKVLQDIEAEDKFLGPLTLKQFIFGAIVVTSLYISFLGLTHNVWFVAVILLPIEIIFGFLAFPWGRDQPTEVWLLAKLRFYFKPRKRIWDQSGMKELVKITVPKHTEQNFSDNLSQNEVKSRLKALATTIDSRGWVIKNVDVNLFAQPSYGSLAMAPSSDRLVAVEELPKQVSTIDVRAEDDIFDNQTAARLDAQIAQSKEAHQQEAVSHMREVARGQQATSTTIAPPGGWFVQSQGGSTPSPTLAKPAIPNANEQALLNKIHEQKSHPDESFRNHRKLQPLSSQTSQAQPKSPGVTATPAPDILNLAIENNRPIDSLAREAEKNHPSQSTTDDGEVIISLR